PLTLDELAKDLSIPPRTARITADAMVALGFLEKQDDRYRNSSVSQTFLSGKTPADLRPFLRFWNHISYPQWQHLEEALRTNRGVSGDVELDPDQQRIFSEGVAAIQAGPAHAMPEKYDFTRHRKVLDLGGGVGEYLVPILDRFPQLEGTLFELPPVTEVARDALAANPVGPRINIVAGDLFEDAIPEDHDALILANVVHYFDHARNLELLRRIRERVLAGARVLIVDFWTNPQHTEPLFAALVAGEFLTSVGGDVFSEEEAKGWLRKTGWEYLQTIPLEGPLSLVVGEAI
ncbi:MAG TPA: methyltransferase, partial [Candidatus Paceibacterota bacterium]|nr:methyltransferase [Candidatus Paceibacterota bacterium]